MVEWLLNFKNINWLNIDEEGSVLNIIIIIKYEVFMKDSENFVFFGFEVLFVFYKMVYIYEVLIKYGIVN